MTDVWLGIHWFVGRENLDRTSRRAITGFVRRRPVLQDIAAGATAPTGVYRPERMAIVWRLVWQAWRQSLATMATIAAVLILLAVFPAGWLVVDRFNFSYDTAAKPLYLVVLALLPLLGTCVFMADQRRNSFRFMADRGVPPKYIWLSRLLVALAPLMITLSVLLFFAYWLAPYAWIMASSHLVYYWGLSMAFVLASVIVGFTAGQLCSMFLRSAILAGLFSVILGLLLTGWCALMLLWQVNWLWSVVPIPLAMLLATRLRAADWLAERNGPRAWLPAGLALAIPAVTILMGVPAYRVYTVWNCSVPFSSVYIPGNHFRPIIFPTGFVYAPSVAPNQDALVNAYRRAIQDMTPRPARTGTERIKIRGGLFVLAASDRVWVNENRALIATLLQLSREKFSHYWSRERQDPFRDYFYRLLQLMEFSALKLETEGDLGGALERYLAVLRIIGQFREPASYSGYGATEQNVESVYAHLVHWATRPGQTSEQITAAIRQLEQLDATSSAGGDRIVAEVLLIERFLSGDVSAARELVPDQPVPPLTLAWLHVPWERTRAMGMLIKITQNKLRAISEAEYGGRHNGRIPLPSWQSRWFDDMDLWKEHPEWPYALHKLIDVPPIQFAQGLGEERMVNGYATMETRRRAVRLILALEAWKLQHGELPETLDELVGPYFDALPVNPCSGEPFLYRRDGVKLAISWQLRPIWAPVASREQIPADRPFIWSIGNRILFEPRNKRFLDRYQIVRGSGFRWYDNAIPSSEYELWEAGWVFPIP